MFREMFPVVPWTEDAARAYADVRAHLEESGKPIGDMKRRGQAPRNADFSGHLRSQPHRNAGAGWRNEITVRTKLRSPCCSVVAGKITNVTIFVWRMCGKSGGIDIRISAMI